MLWIFAFVFFLFYQIFPSVIGGFGPNNPLAAVIMAISVCAICWGFSLLMVRSAVASIREFERSPFLGKFYERGALVWIAAVAVSITACYLIAVGFAPKLLTSRFGEPEWPVWFMFFAPPASLMGFEFVSARTLAAMVLKELRDSWARRDPRW